MHRKKYPDKLKNKVQKKCGHIRGFLKHIIYFILAFFPSRRQRHQEIRQEVRQRCWSAPRLRFMCLRCAFARWEDRLFCPVTHEPHQTPKPALVLTSSNQWTWIESFWEFQGPGISVAPFTHHNSLMAYNQVSLWYKLLKISLSHTHTLTKSFKPAAWSSAALENGKWFPPYLVLCPCETLTIRNTNHPRSCFFLLYCKEGDTNKVFVITACHFNSWLVEKESVKNLNYKTKVTEVIKFLF